MHAVGVAGGVDVRAGLVNLGVYREGGRVDGLVALDYLAGLVDEDEVRDVDLGEVRGERVEPWWSLITR